MSHNDTKLKNHIKKIKILTKKKISSDLIGEFKSIYKGFGLEFTEIKEYQYGDNIKDIDWNITARFNKPYIKKYVEDRNRNIYFAIDISSSVALSNKNFDNFNLTSDILSILLYSALINGDNVSLVLFSDGIKSIIQNRRGIQNFNKLLSFFLSYQNQYYQKTDLAKSLLMLSRVIKKRSIIFLISDFLGNDYEKPLFLLAKKHEVYPIVVSAYSNIQNKIGIVEFTDVETNKNFTIDLSSINKINYNTSYIFEKFNQIFNQKKIKPIFINQNDNVIERFLEYFRSIQKK